MTRPWPKTIQRPCCPSPPRRSSSDLKTKSCVWRACAVQARLSEAVQTLSAQTLMKKKNAPSTTVG